MITSARRVASNAGVVHRISEGRGFALRDALIILEEKSCLAGAAD